MNVRISPQDWLAISAHLDGRLNPKESAKLENRLVTDQGFQHAYQELENTRRVLRALPQRRAPRNFTLSPKTITAPARKRRVQPFFGFASAAATLALTVLFAAQNVFPLLLRAKTAEPMLAAAPAASESAMSTAAEDSTPPMIIFWGTSFYADGKGGGGGGDIGGGDPMTASSLPPVEQPVLKDPSGQPTANLNVDPSTLILGLPQGETSDGENARDLTTQPLRKSLPISTWWMIGLAGFALFSGALSFILRRR
jgi:hypothetical protein